MADEVLYELGIDINSSLSFENGDFKLAKYDENLVQAISNRLNTNLNELDIFYEDYGSIISSFFGWKRNSETLEFVKSEIEAVLNEEERISSFECSVEYDDDLIIKLTLYPNYDYNIDVTYKITDNGVELVNEE